MPFVKILLCAAVAELVLFSQLFFYTVLAYCMDVHKHSTYGEPKHRSSDELSLT